MINSLSRGKDLRMNKPGASVMIGVGRSIMGPSGPRQSSEVA